MTWIPKPRVIHPGLERNALGLTRRDYEGSMSTLCAGCGHDSITAALIEAFWEMDLAPHRVAKMSGIGCSAKTPTYFLGQAHGFNGVHGRMPALSTGAAAANRSLTYIGISGDGDSLSIGLGQMCHAIRRNVDMLYVIENNGVYGLTKGQFSASADVGSRSKRGEENRQRPIDPVLLGLALGATFVARSFSGDKGQLVPILKAGIAHRGFALVDVISPCVTFNDHEGSTKSYLYTRRHDRPAVHADFLSSGANGGGRAGANHGPSDADLPPEGDFVPPAAEITADYDDADTMNVPMHDGSVVRFRKVADDYDPTDRDRAYAFVRERAEAEEVVTGLLYLEAAGEEMHDVLGTVETPLVNLPFEDLCPGRAALDELQEAWR